jgi:hypothetical protein
MTKTAYATTGRMSLERELNDAYGLVKSLENDNVQLRRRLSSARILLGTADLLNPTWLENTKAFLALETIFDTTQGALL